MARRLRRIGALTLVVAALAACTGGESGGSATGSRSAAATASTTEVSGGTVRILAQEPVETWDPQRLVDRHDAAMADRLFLRTLTAYAPVDERGHSQLVGDLATTAGTASADLRSWTYTLREDARWEDGSPVTCADVAFGVARTFAAEVARTGANDAVALLAIPRNPDGTSTYAGPYATGDAAAQGQAAFDAAVVCDGNTVTFNLALPVVDWGAILSQPGLAPVKVGQDPRDAPLRAFSNGPYQLDGPWDPQAGGTFVRNPSWVAQADPVRRAYPDRIEYVIGASAGEVTQDVLGDTDTGRNAVSVTPLAVPLRQQVDRQADLVARSINPGTGLVDYLAPNVKRPVMANPSARLALALATDRAAYVTALGGAVAASPTRSLIPSSLTAAHEVDPVGSDLSGDVAKAREAIAESGLTLPVPITVAYRGGDAADRALAALTRSWNAAGFETQLVALDDSYFTQASTIEASQTYDVFWSTWAPTWDSGSTVLQALFDPTLNLSETSTGRDLGSYSNEEITAEMATIGIDPDPATRELAWADIDTRLLGDVAYIGLAERRTMFVAGSGIRNLAAHPFAGGDVDLGIIAVAP
ncbi:MAG: ABC transporter substrate-binding protein [Phycicoccus sp.]|nr:ABC transporter substrate-binding protein [Phycicoccus sp.]